MTGRPRVLQGRQALQRRLAGAAAQAATRAAQPRGQGGRECAAVAAGRPDPHPAKAGAADSQARAGLLYSNSVFETRGGMPIAPALAVFHSADGRRCVVRGHGGESPDAMLRSANAVAAGRHALLPQRHGRCRALRCQHRVSPERAVASCTSVWSARLLPPMCPHPPSPSPRWPWPRRLRRRCR